MLSTYMPYVEEEVNGNLIRHDLFSRLLKDRIIFLGSAIDDHVSNVIIAQMLHLAQQDPEKDIQLYINSPGGQISSGMAIYDTMQMVSCDVQTICVGMAASMGAVLLSAGTKGKRKILPHSTVLIHQPLGGARGQASDIEITAKEIIRLKHLLTNIMAERSGQSVKRLTKDMDRDYIMTAEQALEYGIVDSIIKKK